MKSLFSLIYNTAIATFLLFSISVDASNVSIPHNFKAGDRAIADHVNENFTAVKTSVDDNNTKINENNSRINIIESGMGHLDRVLTGTVSMSSGSTIVNGTGTLFSSELNLADAIAIDGEKYTVINISSDVSLETNVARAGLGVVNVNLYTDNNLLSLKSGAGAEKALVTKSGEMIRRVARATGLGPYDVTNMGSIITRTLGFKKTRDDTAIRLFYGDNFRVQGDTVACRWELMVNGTSCPSGQLIYDFYSDAVTLNQHRSGTLFGFCEGLSAGVYSIDVHVGPAPGHVGSDCATGWADSRWTIEAEEVF